MADAKRAYKVYATKEKVALISKTNKDHLRKYFVAKNMNLSESSKKSYESDFNQWFVYILENYENIDVLELDASDASDMIEDYIAYCTSVLGNNERRIQRRMSSISSFYLNLKKKKKIEGNPIDYLDRPRVGKGEKLQVKQTFLGKEQVEKIREGLVKLGDLQLRLFFEFGLSTLARANAIANVTIEQIDFKSNRVLEVLEKEGYRVTLFPSKLCMELTEQWLEYRKEHNIDHPNLFLSNFNGTWKNAEKGTLQGSWIKKIGKLIDEDLHCHDLRHSGSNLYFQAGMPLETVSKLLNHKGTQVTQDHYLQINFDKIQDEKEKFEV